MNLEKIFNLLDAKKAYMTSVGNIWTDPYIAKSMLSAHLNESHNAASYTVSNRMAICDLAESVTNISAGEKIVDFGCGPGLYCSELGKRGYVVTGIDQSVNSLDYAREKALEENLSIQYIHADYTETLSMKDFSMAIMISQDYGVQSPQNRRALLNNIRTALNSKGWFLFDVPSEAAYLRKKQNKQMSWHFEEEGFYRPHKYIVLTKSDFFDDVRVINDCYFVIDENETVYRNSNTYFSLERIKKELEDEGFEVVQLYSNSWSTGFDEKAEDIGLVCRKI